MELITRVDLLLKALYAGATYCVFRILISQLYPMTVNLWWQNLIGQIVANKYPNMVQSDDMDRLSYFPTEDKPFVITVSYKPDFDDLTHGIRDGMALGLLIALLPEVTPALITALLFVVMFIHILKISL